VVRAISPPPGVDRGSNSASEVGDLEDSDADDEDDFFEDNTSPPAKRGNYQEAASGVVGHTRRVHELKDESIDKKSAVAPHHSSSPSSDASDEALF